MGISFKPYTLAICTECWNDCFDIYCFNTACQKYNPARKYLTVPAYRDSPILYVEVSVFKPLDMDKVKKDFYAGKFNK